MNLFIFFLISDFQKLDNLESYKIKCCGISTQRNSFLLFNKKTDETYCNLILWNDRRPVDTCNSINRGVMLNTIKKACNFLTTFVPNQRLRAFSKYKVETNQVSPKLVDQLSLLNNELDQDELDLVLYATIETWLVWNLTKEKTFATEVSCACCTGFYDIFKVKSLMNNYNAKTKFLSNVHIFKSRNAGPTSCFICCRFPKVFCQ
jgi:putative glycerol kinase 5